MTKNQVCVTVSASQFKARCLALIDLVTRSGKTVVITKRGKPVAKLLPIAETTPASLRGSVQYHGDIVTSTGETWHAAK
jgi:prevent-host-death family protein